jgi:hypothetical protein
MCQNDDSLSTLAAYRILDEKGTAQKTSSANTHCTTTEMAAWLQPTS